MDSRMTRYKVFNAATGVVLAFAAVSTALAADDGFKPIFDGKTLNGWEGDPAIWRVEDGAITGQTTADTNLKKNTFLIWRQGEVDDFELTLEYKIIGGNSGIQYRSFEVPQNGKWAIGGRSGAIPGDARRPVPGRQGRPRDLDAWSVAGG
jgi:hypothetical protein